MSVEFDVTSDVDLGWGVRLYAAGYRGRGVATEPGDYDDGATRSSTAATTLNATLADAMDRAEMREEQAIELELIPVPSEVPSRSASYGDAVMLEVPDLGEDRGQLVMLTDEDGAISFHFPVESADDQAVQGPSVRGVGNTKLFIIPADVPPDSIHAPDLTAEADVGKDGSFAIPHLRPGEYRVWTHAGWWGWERDEWTCEPVRVHAGAVGLELRVKGEEDDAMPENPFDD